MPQPETKGAETYLMQSLELSRRKGAKAWELRAAIDLAKLFAERGRRQDAKRLLQSAFEGFAMDSETADIRAANSLLGML